MDNKMTWTLISIVVLTAFAMTAGVIIFTEDGNATADYGADYGLSDALGNEAMQSKVPSADLQQSDGQAGQGVSIALRGDRSILGNVNPDAIYGARGGNGVIMITTINGSNDHKFPVTMNETFIKEIVASSDVNDKKEDRELDIVCSYFFASCAEKLGIVEDRETLMNYLFGEGYQEKMLNGDNVYGRCIKKLDRLSDNTAVYGRAICNVILITTDRINATPFGDMYELMRGWFGEICQEKMLNGDNVYGRYKLNLDNFKDNNESKIVNPADVVSNASKIQIRGGGSLNGSNEPLVIVAGTSRSAEVREYQEQIAALEDELEQRIKELGDEKAERLAEIKEKHYAIYDDIHFKLNDFTDARLHYSSVMMEALQKMSIIGRVGGDVTELQKKVDECKARISDCDVMIELWHGHLVAENERYDEELKALEEEFSVRVREVEDHYDALIHEIRDKMHEGSKILDATVTSPIMSRQTPPPVPVANMGEALANGNSICEMLSPYSTAVSGFIGHPVMNLVDLA